MSAAELAAKIETLSTEDFNMVVTLVNRLADKPSNILKTARNKYMRNNPMTMEEIDSEIQQYRSENRS